MAEKRMYNARLTEAEIEWCKQHGGLAAVVRTAMESGPVAAPDRMTRKPKVPKTPVRPSGSHGRLVAAEKCRHPIPRRIGKVCMECGDTV